MKLLTLVGGHLDTIEVFELDIHEDNILKSKLTFKESCKVDEKPTFLHVTNDRIYCVHEVSRFKGERTGGLSFLKIAGCKIYRLQSQFSCGEGPCHVLINPTYNCAYVSNYRSGHFAATKLKSDGLLGGGMYIESYESGSGVIPGKQEGSHPCGAFFKDRHVYVVDCGADTIYHYEHGNGSQLLEGTPMLITTPPGSGPRHMVFHLTHPLVFLVTELSNEVIVYRYEKENGGLEQLSTYTIHANPSEENYGAEIALHPNGKYLYASSTGHGCIVSYKIVNELGKLEKIETFKTTGHQPRHFGIEQTGNIVICADRQKNVVEVLKIDLDSGTLERADIVDCKNQPSCVVFKDFVPLEEICQILV